MVILTIPFEQLPLIHGIVNDLKGLDVGIQFIPDLLTLQTSRMSLEKMGDIPFISLRTTRLSGADRIVKRTFDLVASVLGLLVISPFLLIIAVVVKLTSPGDIIYSQKRMGLDEREFFIYKFRTMSMDAEEKDGARIATQGDARTTSVGKVLRKYSLDEFPQLWNVVRGEMSLVGPRPERKIYVDQYREIYPRYSERHTVKGGLTGWAQVHGLRGDTPIEERTMYDLHYIENWSLARDVKILLMTIGHVINAENAY
jgi:exopolysaccharide biosynthesis polyprenyl glycosylphosphotransferase